MNRIRPLAVLLGVMVLASCDVSQNSIRSIAGPTAGSAVKYFNFGVGDPTVNFYADTIKESAASTTACSSAVNGSTTDSTCLTTGKESASSGTAYGVAAIGGGLYGSITPGAHALSAHIVASVDNGLPIASTSATLADGKFYSYYLSGIYNTTAKTVEAFLVEDPLPAIDFNSANVRFVNAISNSQPMTLYAKSQTTGIEVPIGPSVAYKSAGAFVPLANDIYDLNTRVAGSSTNVITRTGVSFSASRVYTITAYGDITATTAPKKPALDNTVNR